VLQCQRKSGGSVIREQALRAPAKPPSLPTNNTRHKTFNVRLRA